MSQEGLWLQESTTNHHFSWYGTPPSPIQHPTYVGGGAMAVDAVMSMVDVGLGDAVVEAVLPGGEAMNASGHAMEAHA